MKKIILDTNAIMAISEFKLDLFTELDKVCDFPYQVFVVQGTLDELEKIQREQRAKFKQAARVGLLILRTKGVQVIPASGDVDRLLVEHSKQGDLVLTQDMALKQRLQKPYLTIRQKKKVIVVQ